MSTDSLAALVRAFARLRIAGDPDLDLVDALARLISPAPLQATVRPWRDQTVSAPKQTGPIAAASPDGYGTETHTPACELATTKQKAPRAQRPDDRLVGRPATLVRVTERADLEAPKRERDHTDHTSDRHSVEAAGSAPPLQSLFAPGRVRAIVRELATLSSDSGMPDIAAAVQMVARAEPIVRLPRQSISSLGHCVQLLFDAGPAMLPFAADQQQFAASAARLLGRDRVRIADFVHNPLQGVRSQRQVRWEEMRWPGRRSAVIVVSDLGIGSRGVDAWFQADSWRRFVAEAHRRGLRSVVLIPYAHERWPAVAAAFGTALTWDLDTGVQALRRLARRCGKA